MAKMAQKTAARTVVVDLKLCLGCKGCELACAKVHAGFEDIVEAILSEADLVPRVRVVSAEGRAVPVQCLHCEDAPCMAFCPSDAITRETDGGPVLLDPEKCTGCKACIAVCPFGAVRWDESASTAVKCDLCLGLIERDELPACVAACPTGARRIVSVGDDAAPDAVLEQYRRYVEEWCRVAEAPRYEIDPEACICCGRCARKCPVDCITGKPGKDPAKATEEDRQKGKVGEPFQIDREVCIGCGTCFDLCPVDAVRKVEE